jgi:hypothetical protein
MHRRNLVALLACAAQAFIFPLTLLAADRGLGAVAHQLVTPNSSGKGVNPTRSGHGAIGFVPQLRAKASEKSKSSSNGLTLAGYGAPPGEFKSRC